MNGSKEQRRRTQIVSKAAAIKDCGKTVPWAILLGLERRWATPPQTTESQHQLKADSRPAQNPVVCRQCDAQAADCRTVFVPDNLVINPDGKLITLSHWLILPVSPNSGDLGTNRPHKHGYTSFIFANDPSVYGGGGVEEAHDLTACTWPYTDPPVLHTTLVTSATAQGRRSPQQQNVFGQLDSKLSNPSSDCGRFADHDTNTSTKSLRYANVVPGGMTGRHFVATINLRDGLCV
ncbi:hypothetical protein ACOMHN_060403 [Nucella lapillus]